MRLFHSFVFIILTPFPLALLGIVRFLDTIS